MSINESGAECSICGSYNCEYICTECLAEFLMAERAKIADEMMLHVRAEPSLPPRWVADLIAKLQKGESQEVHS